jgi:hypothetical protein
LEEARHLDRLGANKVHSLGQGGEPGAGNRLGQRIEPVIEVRELLGLDQPEVALGQRKIRMVMERPCIRDRRWHALP